MDFGTLLHRAQRNENSAKKEVRCYKATFDPPKKEQKAKTLSANIQKFLARKEEEEKRKTEEAKRKRDELLALRSQDGKAKKRVAAMLNRTKAANKSAIEDAVDNENTAVTLGGLAQPDEDDYGYVSQEATAFYAKLMEKYQSTPSDDSKNPKKALLKSSVADLNNTKDRVRMALLRVEEEEMMPHKRKRKTKEEKLKESEGGDRASDQQDYEDAKDYEEEKRAEKPAKPRRPPAPPPMDFHSLLKLAEKKQFEPIKFEPKVKDEDEDARPMTKKQRAEYEREREWRLRKEGKLPPLSSSQGSSKEQKSKDQKNSRPPDQRNARPALDQRNRPDVNREQQSNKLPLNNNRDQGRFSEGNREQKSIRPSSEGIRGTGFRDNRPSGELSRERDSRSFEDGYRERDSYRERDNRPSGDDYRERDSYRERDNRPSGDDYRERDNRPSGDDYRERDSRPPGGGYRERESRPSSEGFRERDNRPSGDSYRERDSRPYGDGYRERESRPSGDGYRERESRPSGDGYRERETRPSGDGYRERETRPYGDGYRERDSRPSVDGFRERDSRPSVDGYRERESRPPGDGYRERESRPSGDDYRDTRASGDGYQNKNSRPDKELRNNRPMEGSKDQIRNRTNDGCANIPRIPKLNSSGRDERDIKTPQRIPKFSESSSINTKSVKLQGNSDTKVGKDRNRDEIRNVNFSGKSSEKSRDEVRNGEVSGRQSLKSNQKPSSASGLSSKSSLQHKKVSSSNSSSNNSNLSNYSKKLQESLLAKLQEKERGSGSQLSESNKFRVPDTPVPKLKNRDGLFDNSKGSKPIRSNDPKELMRKEINSGKIPGRPLSSSQRPNGMVYSKSQESLQKNKPGLPDRRPAQVPSKDIKPRQFPPADVKPRQFPPPDVKPRQFPPADVKSRQFPPAEVRRKPKPPMKRRIMDSDEEYDSELDDFIDDGPLEEEDYSKHIREIFGYDKSRYRDMDDGDECMESSFSQQLKEEFVSTKLGMMEDLEDMALEKKQLEKKKKKAMTVKKKRRL